MDAHLNLGFMWPPLVLMWVSTWFNQRLSLSGKRSATKPPRLLKGRACAGVAPAQHVTHGLQGAGVGVG